jgi:hypothetical protein
MDPDPDPAIFVLDLQGANKKLIFKKFFCLLLFKGTFTSFFKDKKSKEVTKQQNSRNHGFSYYFCLMIDGSGAGSGSATLLVNSHWKPGQEMNRGPTMRQAGVLKIHLTPLKLCFTPNSSVSVSISTKCKDKLCLFQYALKNTENYDIYETDEKDKALL